jgi:hypothetical protein
MQIQQFGFVFHYMDFNSLFQCVLWFGGAQQQQQQWWRRHWVQAC